MFDFADVTETGILCENIQFTFGVFCPLTTVIQETQETNGIICSFNLRRKGTSCYSILMQYEDAF